MTKLFADLIQDFRFAVRQMRKQPGLASIAMLLLGLGIGGSAAVFSVLYQAVLKPLPYPDAQQLLFIHNVFPRGQMAVGGVSGFDYSQIKRHTDVFAKAGVFYWNDLTLTGFGSARHVDVVNASAGVFEALRVPPQLGRIFSEAEDQSGAPGTVLLSDALWRNLLGADPAALGRVIQLNGAPYTVIGVMPAAFQFPSRETQLWIPAALRKGEATIQGGRTEKWLHMVARLSPEANLAKAQSVLYTIGDQLARSYPFLYPENQGWHLTARQIADEQTQAVRRWLYLAFGAVCSVLLIACINVSGLLLVRMTARQGEMAVRMAVGATKSRIVRHTLTEAGVLAAVGCLGGLTFAFWAVHLINTYGPLQQPTKIENLTLLFALGLGLVSTLGAGWLPALLAVRVPVEEGLKGGTSRIARRGSGWRNGIVAAQIGLAVTLVFTAAQLSRSFLNLTRVPTGFNGSGVWTGALDLPPSHYAADQSWNTRFFEPLMADLRLLPGVEAVSAANAIPFFPGGVWTESLRLPGQQPKKGSPPPEAQISLALPGYFETLQIPLLEGRTFNSRDRPGAPPVAVIDEELARRYFPGQDPLGKPIASGGAATPAHIIGVVGSVHNQELGGPHEPEVYYPELQERTETMYLVMRLKMDRDPTAAVRRAVARFDRGVPLYDVRSMRERVDASVRLRRFIAFLLNALAATGMSLAIIGLYGSLTHLVELRQREIGVRMALGAMRSDVVRIVVGRGGVIVLAGLVAGALGALLAGLAVRNQLFGVQLTDGTTWTGVLGAILAAAAIAAFVPAWRAARIEPSAALRHE